MKRTLTITTGIIGVAAILDLVFGVFEKPKEIRKINVSGECLTSVPKDRTAITASQLWIKMLRHLCGKPMKKWQKSQII